VVQSAEASSRSTASYTVRLEEEDRRLLKVEAVIETTESELLMFADNYDASHLQGGWASFVRNLRLRDENGADVALEPSGLSRWRLPSGGSRKLRMSYEVLVHHDQGHWPVGWDEAAYAKRNCDCVMATGMAVFIGSEDLRDIRVEFELPGGYEDRPPWRSVAPWKRIGGTPDAYEAADFTELSEVAFVVGNMPVEEIRAGQAEIEIAVGRGIPGGARLIRRAAEDYLGAVTSLLGAPPDGRFVVVANPDVYSGGGAFIRSVSMLFQQPPTWSDRSEWGHVLAHELVHLWNGHVLQYAASEEWIKEGVTDYLSRLVQLRAGHLSEERFFENLVRGYPWYLKQVGEVSLREAGAKKQDYAVLVYDGGLFAGLAIDIELRRRTDGLVGLPDVIAELYDQAPPRGARVGLDDLGRAAASLGAGDLSPFIANLAGSREPTALGFLLAELGYDLFQDEDQGIWETRPLPTPSSSAEALRRCLFEGCRPVRR
jgi:predicted metalloprotease with PDZ domain